MRLKGFPQWPRFPQSQVSIPKGAIEGFSYEKVPKLFSCFNTKRCDWRIAIRSRRWTFKKVSIPKGAIEGRSKGYVIGFRPLFQYQKVRLKVNRIKIKTLPPIIQFQYQKVRLKVATASLMPACGGVSIPKGAIEGHRPELETTQDIRFQYQKVRLKGFKYFFTIRLFASFNTKRCDWRS